MADKNNDNKQAHEDRRSEVGKHVGKITENIQDLRNGLGPMDIVGAVIRAPFDLIGGA